MICERPTPDARDLAPAALRAGTHNLFAVAGGVRLDLQNRTALSSGARTAFQIYALSSTENFSRNKYP
jgi:hypothetical protein